MKPLWTLFLPLLFAAQPALAETLCGTVNITSGRGDTPYTLLVREGGDIETWNLTEAYGEDSGLSSLRDGEQVCLKGIDESTPRALYFQVEAIELDR